MTVMQIKKLDNYGRGITYYNDAIMFVDNAIPNEKITVKNITKKKKFYEAEVDEIIESTSSRVVPKCPFYNQCGGCNMMHMSDDLQKEFKQNKVSEILGHNSKYPHKCYTNNSPFPTPRNRFFHMSNIEHIRRTPESLS